jgi:hypothetical protein
MDSSPYRQVPARSLSCGRLRRAEEGLGARPELGNQSRAQEMDSGKFDAEAEQIKLLYYKGLSAALHEAMTIIMREAHNLSD